MICELKWTQLVRIHLSEQVQKSLYLIRVRTILTNFERIQTFCGNFCTDLYVQPDYACTYNLVY